MRQQPVVGNLRLVAGRSRVEAACGVRGSRSRGQRADLVPGRRRCALGAAAVPPAGLALLGGPTRHGGLSQRAQLAGRDSAHSLGLPLIPRYRLERERLPPHAEKTKSAQPSGWRGNRDVLVAKASLSRREFVPARTCDSAPKPGADAYDVTFYDNGRIVPRASTKKNHFVLPRLFRFQAGRYRSTAQLLPFAQGEPPITDSPFSVSAAAEEAANKQ